MTGSGALWGMGVKGGADLQAAIVNSEGGLQVGNRKCKVKVVSVDDQCTAAGGAAASNYLAGENVAVMTGPLCSPATTGLRPVAKRYGQVSISPSNMKDVLIPEFPLVFHSQQGPWTFAPILIKEAKAKFKFNTVVVMGPNDQGGTDNGKVISKAYADQGVKVTEEWYQRGTTNFRLIANRIMRLNPDVLELAGTPPGDVAPVVKALLESGFQGIFGGLGGVGIAPVIRGADGVDKIKGCFWLELMPMDDPGAHKLRADYERLLKSAPPDIPALYVSSTAVEQILHAISLAGTDRDGEKIAAALRKMTPKSRYFGPGGWRGKTQFGMNQELAFPIGMGAIVAGKNLGVVRI